MTMQDVLAVGGGSFFLLIVFLAAGYFMHGGTLDLWAVVRRYVALQIGDELVRTSLGTGSDAGSAGAGDPARGQQHQLEPVEPGENEPPPITRQLGKEEMIVLLAVQRNDDGGYKWSANKIAAFVGGTEAPVKATIATVRGTKDAPKPGAPLKRPVNGW